MFYFRSLYVALVLSRCTFAVLQFLHCDLVQHIIRAVCESFKATIGHCYSSITLTSN